MYPRLGVTNSEISDIQEGLLEYTFLSLNFDLNHQYDQHEWLRILFKT